MNYNPPTSQFYYSKYMYVFLSALLLIATIFTSVKSSAQNGQYLFKTYNTDDGLSDNHVNAILRDSKGFLWIGTNDGLNRFDGSEFRNYRYDPQDSTSLLNNSVYFLSEYIDGTIWIGGGDSLEIFNPELNQFTHTNKLFNGQLDFEPESKWQVKITHDSNIIYKCTELGLYKYYPKTDSLVTLIQTDYTGADTSHAIWCIDFDSEENLWSLDNRGLLIKMQQTNNQFTDTIIVPHPKNNYQKVFIDKDDNFWVIDRNNNPGVYFIENKTHSVSLFSTNSDKCRLNSNLISNIVEDETGNIWIATDHGGINIVNKSNLKVNYIKNIPFDDRSLPQNSIWNIYVDKGNFIWLGTFNKGLSYYHANMNRFKHIKFSSPNKDYTSINDISSFAEDKKGNIWIGTNGEGLIYYEPKTNNFTLYRNNPNDPASLSSNIIIGLTFDNKGNLWIGTYYGGLNMWDGKKFTHYKSDIDNPYSITDDRVWDILEASNGMLYIATLQGGVNIMDPSTGKVVETFSQEHENTIKSTVTFTITEDSKQQLWFATIHGLQSYNLKTKNFTYYRTNSKDETSISDNVVYDILEDNKGFIWASTYNGLSILNTTTGKFQRLFNYDGLPSNTIYQLQKDNTGNIWASSTRGLSCISPTPDSSGQIYLFEIQNYTTDDGLQGDEFKDMASLKTNDGKLLFGGTNGFNIFDPENINKTMLKSDIVLTNLWVQNTLVTNKVKINDEYILEKDISFTNEITLSYTEDFISIEFADLNFLHPDKQAYEYKLEGLNEQWVKTNPKNNIITFTNLDPGEYTLKIRPVSLQGQKAASNYNILTIIIKPPLWGKIWFQLILAILVIALIINRFQRINLQKTLLGQKVEERTRELTDLNEVLKDKQNKIKVQNAELTEHRTHLEKLVQERTSEMKKALKKAKESDQLKSAFLANMSHEIRTPMNAIIGFCEMLGEDDISAAEHDEYLGIIQKNSDSLLVIIDDILDLSKIEANQIQLYKNDFDVINMLIGLESIYKIDIKEGVSIMLKYPKGLPELIINQDEIRIRQILQNLITNAIKYTEKGRVEFGFNLEDNKIWFYVKDTGIGIPLKNKESIFMPFTKIEDKSRGYKQGAGLGLAISKKFATLMNAELFYESEIGKGTTFHFNLPFLPNEDKEAIEKVISE